MPTTPTTGWAGLAARVPAAFFGVVLGLGGLAGSWRAAAATWGASDVPGAALELVALAAWLVVATLYAAKWVWAREAALAEWHHPVQGCFVALVPVTALLLAAALAPRVPGAARVLFAVGAVLQLAFAAWRTGDLWGGARDPLATTPVLYLPTVAGGFVLATASAAFGFHTLGLLAFGMAFFSWLALESVVVHRLLLHAPLATPLMPTLGIQIAPPVVGGLAWLSLTEGPPDALAHALLGYGVLEALVLARIAPRLLSAPFAPSYWAFTFAATALATLALRMVGRGVEDLAWLAAAAFVLANLVVGAIALGTIVLLVRGRLLPARAARPAAP